jgi:methionyl-tRNA formyltransferase
MKIIFFGTSEFAAESLKKLVSSGYDCLSVVTSLINRKAGSLRSCLHL